MITLEDVALAARVSVSTASRALAGNSQISHPTILKVRRAAERLGYRPNSLARGLKTNSSRLVGLVVHNIFNATYQRVAQLIQAQLAARDYQVILCISNDDPHQEALYLNTLLDHRVDGLIIVPTGSNLDLLERMASHDIPVVTAIRRHARTGSTQFCKRTPRALTKARNISLNRAIGGSASSSDWAKRHRAASACQDIIGRWTGSACNRSRNLFIKDPTRSKPGCSMRGPFGSQIPHLRALLCESRSLSRRDEGLVRTEHRDFLADVLDLLRGLAVAELEKARHHGHRQRSRLYWRNVCRSLASAMSNQTRSDENYFGRELRIGARLFVRKSDR